MTFWTLTCSPPPPPKIFVWNLVKKQIMRIEWDGRIDHGGDNEFEMSNNKIYLFSM